MKKILARLLSASWIASLPKELRDQAARNLSPETARKLRQSLHYDWSEQARDSQKPPPGDWRVWLLLAGRGFGKTRTGAEYVRAQVKAGTARRVALVAPTAADARSVMVEGESGLLAIGPPEERPDYEPSKHQLTWSNGAIATTEQYGDAACANPPSGDALSTAIWFGSLVGQLSSLTSEKAGG
jgi:phage terminase large subunit-like protein